MARVLGRPERQDLLISHGRDMVLDTAEGVYPLSGKKGDKPDKPGITYYGLEAARQELIKRQSCSRLRAKIRDCYLSESRQMNSSPLIRDLRKEQGLPEEVNLYSMLPNPGANAPFAVLTRQISALNFESLWFCLCTNQKIWRENQQAHQELRDWLGPYISLLGDRDIPSDILQYQEDGYSGRNLFKWSLLQPGIASLKENRAYIQSIHLNSRFFDQDRAMGKIRLNQVRNKNPSPSGAQTPVHKTNAQTTGPEYVTLGDFHNRLFRFFFPGMALQDISLFFKSIFRERLKNNARSYYRLYLMFALQNIILMENFSLSGSCPGEKKFTEDIVLPALEEIESCFGLAPLIVPVSPFKPETIRWYYLPASPPLSQALKAQGIVFPPGSRHESNI